ncbi:unnamed protein product [Ectocarpus sp. 12 AP-2014]
MPSQPRGTAPQQCTALTSGVGFVSRSTAAESASGNTLLLVHPAAGCGLPQQQQPRRRHVRSRPRGFTSSLLTLTNRSTMNRPRHCPRDGSVGLDGSGAWRGVCGALLTAASPTTTADVFDAAAATGVERLGEEGEQRERICSGGSAAAVSDGVGESPAGVSAGSPTTDANMQNSGTRINERSRRLPAPGTPARLVVEAKKSASAAAAFMRRMTEAGKKGSRWRDVVPALEEMRSLGLVTDGRPYTVAIKALGDNGKTAEALKLLESMRDGRIPPNEFSYTAAASACAKTGDWKGALRLLGQMREQDGLEPNEFTYTAAVTACGRGGNLEAALSLLDGMRGKGVSPNCFTYNSAIHACARKASLPADLLFPWLGKWKLALELIERMKADGVTPNLTTYSSAADACAKGGNCAAALKILEEVRSLDLEVGEILYNSVMEACAAVGQTKLSLSLLETMRKDGVKPSPATYTTAITACGRTADWKRALMLLVEMRKSFPSRALDVNRTVAAAAASAAAAAGQREGEAVGSGNNANHTGSSDSGGDGRSGGAVKGVGSSHDDESGGTDDDSEEGPDWWGKGNPGGDGHRRWTKAPGREKTTIVRSLNHCVNSTSRSHNKISPTTSSRRGQEQCRAQNTEGGARRQESGHRRRGGWGWREMGQGGGHGRASGHHGREAGGLQCGHHCVWQGWEVGSRAGLARGDAVVRDSAGRGLVQLRHLGLRVPCKVGQGGGSACGTLAGRVEAGLLQLLLSDPRLCGSKPLGGGHESAQGDEGSRAWSERRGLWRGHVGAGQREAVGAGTGAAGRGVCPPGRIRDPTQRCLVRSGHPGVLGCWQVAGRLGVAREHAHCIGSDTVPGVLQRRAARHGLRGGGQEGQGPHRDHAEGAEDYAARPLQLQLGHRGVWSRGRGGRGTGTTRVYAAARYPAGRV